MSRAGDKSKIDAKFRIKSQRSSAQLQPCATTLFQPLPDISSSAWQQNYSSQYQSSHAYQRLAEHLEIREGSSGSLWKCLLSSELHLTNLQHWHLSFLVLFKNKVTPFSRVSAFWNKTGELPQLSLSYKGRKRSLHVLVDSIITRWWKHPGDTSIWWEQTLSWDTIYCMSTSELSPACRSYSQDREARSHGRSCLTTQKYISQMHLKPSHHHRALNPITIFSKGAGNFWPFFFFFF